MDERMHDTPWYWTTHEPSNSTHAKHDHMLDVGLRNCHPKNLVQMGIGGWYGLRPGAVVARRRGTSVMTITDITEMGVKKAAEVALDLAWEGCDAVYLSFDIDSVDAGFCARHGLARARRPTAPRGARAVAPDCAGRHLRYGGG